MANTEMNYVEDVKVAYETNTISTATTNYYPTINGNQISVNDYTIIGAEANGAACIPYVTATGEYRIFFITWQSGNIVSASVSGDVTIAYISK